MKFELPQLPYSYNALEPYIDARTMEIHHTKHHQGYVDKLNKALEKHPDLFGKSPESLLWNVNQVPEDIRQAVINHSGGHVNHSLYWMIMASPDQGGGGEPVGAVADAINAAFSNFDNFKEELSVAALGVFGSGWGWLVVNQNKELKIITTPNQNSPLMDGNNPIFGIDMWEHAFYVLRNNRKNEYVDAFWNVVNWEQVDENYEKVK